MPTPEEMIRSALEREQHRAMTVFRAYAEQVGLGLKDEDEAQRAWEIFWAGWAAQKGVTVEPTEEGEALAGKLIERVMTPRSVLLERQRKRFGDEREG